MKNPAFLGMAGISIISSIAAPIEFSFWFELCAILYYGEAPML